jgi:DNA processing protein
MHVAAARKPRTKYAPPSSVRVVHVADLIAGARSIPPSQRDRFGFTVQEPKGFQVWCAGELDYLKLPCVSIVGTRKVSEAGTRRARKLARELSAAGVVVVSGLAMGVDSIAMNAAIESRGVVVGVIGTGIDRAYPAENAELQERVYREHLLISQFAPEERVFKANFPKRNQLMAAVSDATAIIEASDTSGTLHQAAECMRLARPLFIAKSVVDDPAVTWTARFVGKPRVHVLTETAELLKVLRERGV